MPGHHAQRPSVVWRLHRPFRSANLRTSGNFLCRSRRRIDDREVPASGRCRAASREVLRGKEQGVDAIFTTGGTGVGPRDIAPETIAPLCDKLIPGIMEHIRAKFGADNPRARLSRAIAGVAGRRRSTPCPAACDALHGRKSSSRLADVLYTKKREEGRGSRGARGEGISNIESHISNFKSIL